MVVNLSDFSEKGCKTLKKKPTPREGLTFNKVADSNISGCHNNNTMLRIPFSKASSFVLRPLVYIRII